VRNFRSARFNVDLLSVLRVGSADRAVEPAFVDVPLVVVPPEPVVPVDPVRSEEVVEPAPEGDCAMPVAAARQVMSNAADHEWRRLLG
jgi:hypothetical protein